MKGRVKVPVLDGLLHPAHPPQHQLSLDFPVFFLQKSKSRTELGELRRREREREREAVGFGIFWLGS